MYPKSNQLHQLLRIYLWKDHPNIGLFRFWSSYRIKASLPLFTNSLRSRSLQMTGRFNCLTRLTTSNENVRLWIDDATPHSWRGVALLRPSRTTQFVLFTEIDFFLIFGLHFILKNFKVRHRKNENWTGPQTYQLFILPIKIISDTGI